MDTKQQETSSEMLIIELEELPRKWGWMLALGVLMVVAGFFGLYIAVAVTLATVLLYGGMLMAGGILSLVHSFRVKEEKWYGRIPGILLALLYIGTSIIIFLNPVAASAALTLVLAALFMGIGALRIGHGFRCRKRGWKWLLPVLVGLADCVFALVIAFSWPVSGLWVIGLFVSVELIMNGWIVTLTALAVRKMVSSGAGEK